MYISRIIHDDSNFLLQARSSLNPPRMCGTARTSLTLSGSLFIVIVSALSRLAKSAAIASRFHFPSAYRHAIHLNGSHSTRDFSEVLNDSRVDFVAIELHRLQSDQMLGFTKSTPTRNKVASPAWNNTSLRGLDISCNRCALSQRLRRLIISFLVLMANVFVS